MSRILIFTFSAVFFCVSSNSYGQLSSKTQADLEQLAKLVENPEPFAPLPPSALADAKQKLQDDLKGLEQKLAASGAGISAGWKKYLQWDEINTQINAEKPSRTTLLKVADKFRQNYAGLEMSIFVDARQSLNRFVNVSTFSNEAVAKRYYDARIKIIKSTFEKLINEPNDRLIALLGVAAFDLENAGQCPQLIKQIRKTFAKPNFHMQISESLAQRITNSQSTTDVRPVHEVIMGVIQQGTAHTTAKFDVDFLPSDASARFAVTIDGMTVSDQVGHKKLGMLGAIQICSQGHTSLRACTVIDFDGDKVTYSNLGSDAKTKTDIQGINTPPLLRRVVMRQVEKKKPEGESIAAERARQKFADNVREQLSTAVAKANKSIKAKLKTPARRLDFEPRRFEVRTSDNVMHMLALVGNSNYLSSLRGPSTESKNDIVVQVHESVVNNTLQHLFGGKTMTNSDMRKMLKSFGVEPKAPDPDERELTITFPRVRPISVAFQDDGLQVKIAMDRLQQGSASSRKIEITTNFAITTTPESIEIKRKGDIKIDFLIRYTNAESILEANMKPKLEEIFTKEGHYVDIDSLEIPEQLLKVGVPTIANFNIQKGWLTSELNIVDESDSNVSNVRNLNRTNLRPVKRVLRAPSNNGNTLQAAALDSPSQNSQSRNRFQIKDVRQIRQSDVVASNGPTSRRSEPQLKSSSRRAPERQVSYEIAGR